MRYVYESISERAESLFQMGMSRGEMIEELEVEFPHYTTGTIVDVVDDIIEEFGK